MNALGDTAPGEASAAVRGRVVAAREIAAARQGTDDIDTRTNATASIQTAQRHCVPDEGGRALLAKAVDKLGLSARAHGKVLRVARTIADLDGGGGVKAVHIAEAVQMRVVE